MTENTETLPKGATARLERSRSDRMVAGVSGGLAKYFDIHPAVYRVGFVVLTLLGGAGIIIYLAAALVMPDEGAEDSIVTRALKQRRERPWPVIGIGLVGVALASLLSHATLWPDGDAWIPLLIAGAAILWITRQGVPTADATAAATADSHRLRRFLRGVVIAFVALVALVLAIVAITIATLDVQLDNGVGSRSYTVLDQADLRDSYALGVGRLTVDMSELPFGEGTTRVDARVDIGQLTVVVPHGVAVRVTGEVDYGDVTVFGRTENGHEASISTGKTARSQLVLDAHVNAGEVHVVRATD